MTDPDGLIVGVAVAGLTTTLVLPAAELQPETVTVTEYVPASAAVAFGTLSCGSAAFRAATPAPRPWRSLMTARFLGTLSAAAAAVHAGDALAGISGQLTALAAQVAALTGTGRPQHVR